MKNKVVYSLLLFVLSISFAKAQYTYIYFQNNTPLRITTKATQTGGSLAANRWWASTDTVIDWGKTKQVMWMSRDAGITNGVDFFFNLQLYFGADSVSIKVKLNGNLVGSDMWLSSAGPGFSDPWYMDNSFHENIFTVNNKTYSLKYYSYFTGGYDDLRYVLHEVNPYPADTAFTNKATNLSVLAYNIYMLTPPIAITDQAERATELGNVVHGYDALLLSEAFYNTVRTDNLIPGLSVEYPYYTAVVDKSGATEDGGVMIFSKYPIEYEAQMNYSDCDGTDCLSAKGVMYARLNKNGKKYHLFATHTQAWNAVVDVNVRVNQFLELRNFIAAQHIDSREPVIIGGDLNVDKIVNNQNEYYRMFDSLQAIEPTYYGNRFSYDIDRNNYASSGTEYLDYVLPIKKYFVPYTTANEVRVIRSKADPMFDMNDLSDHFSVYGRLEYPYITAQPISQNVCEGEKVVLVTKASHPMYFTWLKNNIDSSITVNNDSLLFATAGLSDSGSYHCQLSYANGGVLSSDTILLTILRKPKLNNSNPTPVCLPSSVDLALYVTDTANVSGTYSYWKDSLCTIPATNPVVASGSYFVKKTAVSGCYAVAKVVVTIVSPTAPVLQNINDTLYSDIPNGNQWYSTESGMISGATSAVFIPTASGHYYTTVTDPYCGVLYSDTLYIAISSIPQINNDEVKIYPNPVSGLLLLNAATEWEQLEIMTTDGRVVYADTKHKQLQIATADWQKGIYIIRIANSEKKYITKLVVQ